MNYTCIGQPQPLGVTYIHPFYLTYIDVSKNSLNKKYSCPTKYYIENNTLYGLDFVDKDHNTSKEITYFDIHVLLYITYGIMTLKDAIAWTKDNISKYHTKTIDRVWDMVWESIITRDALENINTLDELVSIYHIILQNDPILKNASYGDIEKALLNVGKKYLGTYLTFHSAKSFQKKIKKSIASYIQ